MSETKTVSSNFVVIGGHSDNPKFFWRGKELTEVKEARIDIESDGGVVKLRVHDTPNFNMQYDEMENEGIIIKRK